jgi:hypothetical protein
MIPKQTQEAAREPKPVQDVTIDGRAYIATGDYPDGRYALEIKDKGAAPIPGKTETEKAADQIAAAGINWAELQKSDLGKAVTLLVSAWSGIPEADLLAAKTPEEQEG